ncbi:MAG: restriction endonuclease [Candidatus Bathyarchaeota archaeon]
MNIDLLVSILRNSTNSVIETNVLSEETRIPLSIIKKNICGLIKEELVSTIERGKIKISEKQRLNLAIFALQKGADLERVCQALGWKEFEDFVAFVLEQNNFKTIKHYRFKGVKRRYEIDVIGLKKPLLLSVECKHWKRSWRRAATISAIQTQIERTISLSQFLPEPRDRLGIAIWSEVEIIPLLLTLSNTPIKIFEGVPVIPIRFLNNFLNEMLKYMENFMIITKRKEPKQEILSLK